MLPKGDGRISFSDIISVARELWYPFSGYKENLGAEFGYASKQRSDYFN